MSDREVIIYWKNIQFDVVLSREMIWPFAMAFGEEFAKNDSYSGERSLRPIDSYLSLGIDFHVRVSVCISREQEFYDFLRRFSQEHNLPIREEGLKPGRS